MNFPRVRRLLFLAALFGSLPAIALAAPADGKAVPSADAPETALKKLSVAPGLQVDLWAAEPLLANPVAFTFDEKGRAYVAETGRRRSTVPDIRKNEPWLLSVLAMRSVEDRIEFFKKTYPANAARPPTKELPDFNKDGQFDWRDWEIEGERLKLVADTDGDGRADQASVFAEGFNTLATGIGAGVAAQGGKVWFACIPDLWRIEGPPSPGGESGSAIRPLTAPAKEKLLTGFGVHVAYSGHDMHGLRFGPDGKLYWTIADCGARVTSREGKVFALPDTGAVFRAEPDGTELEVVATGLRNPQHLAFNDLGDLFTGDNNADGGDAARWVHVVEGSDSGWRLGWQFLPKLGAWNAERLWDLDTGRTALSQVPPVAHIGHGPAGIAHYPGTGLPEAYRGHFFYADFPGGVRAFALKKNGASYMAEAPGDVLVDNKAAQMNGKLLWGLDPSDVQFGTDGGAYVLDWTTGWEKTGKGRIFRVHDPAVDGSALVLETKKLLAEGMASRDTAELLALLGHADQRVRLAAQYALAGQGESAVAPLAEAAGGRDRDKLARLHAIWALGQIGRRSPQAFAPLVPLLTAAESEVRAQSAKVVGDARQAANVPRLIPLLQDAEPRVRFFAAMALGKCASRDAVPPLLALLRENADPFIRHAAVMGLVGSGDLPALTTSARDPSGGVRAGVLLALRRLRSPEVAAFLQDWDPQLVLEAARAIHDEPIDAAIPHLAAYAGQPGLAAPVARRAINGAYHLGTVAAARALAAAATNSALPEPVRLDALDALTHWNTALGRDRVLGVARPLPAARDAQAAAVAGEIVAPLLQSGSDAVRVAAAGMAASLKSTAAEPALFAAVSDAKLGGKVRASALVALAALPSPRLSDAVRNALASDDQALLEEARRLSTQLSPTNAAEQLAALLENGSIAEKQNALQALGSLPGGAADKLLAQWLDRLAAGKVPSPIRLDLLVAASQRSDAKVKQQLAAYETARDATDPVARWQECLEGGDAKRGREIFYEKAEAACLRCHKVGGEGGDVGPDLAGIGAKHDRAYLLASIVAPNATIAPGYENVLLTMKDGSMIAGLVSADSVDELTITALGTNQKSQVKKAAIAASVKVPSVMPEGLGEVLGKPGLRDVIEYLAGLK